MASSQKSKKIISPKKSGLDSKKLIKQYSGQLPSEELDILLALALHKKVEYIYKNSPLKISTSATKKFVKLVRQRRAGWSIAYLRGYKEFFGYKFLINKHTLIPRPESEIIVEQTLAYLKKYKLKNPHIIDIGTGSGCLILSVAKNYSQADYTATDISIHALQIARTNARKLGLKKQIKFYKSNLLKKINTSASSVQKFDIILANLPYLKLEQMKEASIKKEPRVALLAGADGLSYYRKLLEQIPPHLNKKYLILLEIDPSQKDLIAKNIKANLPKAKIKFLKDLAGHFRIAQITD